MQPALRYHHQQRAHSPLLMSCTTPCDDYHRASKSPPLPSASRSPARPAFPLCRKIALPFSIKIASPFPSAADKPASLLHNPVISTAILPHPHNRVISTAILSHPHNRVISTEGGASAAAAEKPAALPQTSLLVFPFPNTPDKPASPLHNPVISTAILSHPHNRVISTGGGASAAVAEKPAALPQRHLFASPSPGAAKAPRISLAVEAKIEP